MRIFRLNLFKEDYQKLPPDIRRRADEKITFLITNPRHPSLRAKKLPGTSIWYARLARAYRFTFQHQEDIIFLRRAGTHDILKKERGK